MDKKILNFMPDSFVEESFDIDEDSLYQIIEEELNTYLTEEGAKWDKAKALAKTAGKKVKEKATQFAKSDFGKATKAVAKAAGAGAGVGAINGASGGALKNRKESGEEVAKGAAIGAKSGAIKGAVLAGTGMAVAQLVLSQQKKMLEGRLSKYKEELKNATTPRQEKKWKEKIRETQLKLVQLKHK